MPAAEWSVLLYLAAHNDLSQHGVRSLDQVLRAGAPPRVVVSTLIDTPYGVRRHVLHGPGASTAEAIHSYDSGSIASLVETARWAFGRQPARRHALVLWSHGTGWQPRELARRDAVRLNTGAVPALFRETALALDAAASGAGRAVCFDDGSQHALDAVALGEAARRIARDLGKPIDVLGLDACLMATVEVAAELHGPARTLVASQELTPATSWPYDALLAGLLAAPEQDAGSLARGIVAACAEWYRRNPPRPNGGDVAFSAVSVEALPPLLGALDALADALRAGMPAAREGLWAAQRTTQNTQTRSGLRQPSKFDYQLWDARSLAAALGDAGPDRRIVAAANAVRAALAPGPTVLAEHHAGAWFDGLGALSVYCPPPDVSALSAAYGRLAFAKRGPWAALLEAYNPQQHG